MLAVCAEGLDFKVEGAETVLPQQFLMFASEITVGVPQPSLAPIAFELDHGPALPVRLTPKGAETTH